LRGLICRPSAHGQPVHPAHARGSVGKDVHPSPSAWPASGGEMGARIRALDWEKSPLGPISSWPQSKSTVDLMMASQLAMNLIWGPGRIQIYNDTNRAFLGRSILML
jgi:hypothetical protein